MILLRHPACLHLLLSLTHPIWFSLVFKDLWHFATLFNTTNQELFWLVSLLWHIYVSIYSNLISKIKRQLVDLEQCEGCATKSGLKSLRIVDIISVYVLFFFFLVCAVSGDALSLREFYCPLSLFYLEHSSNLAF